MNIKKNFIFHQKSKSINNKLSIKEFDFNSNIPNGQPKNEIYTLNNNNKNKKVEEKIKIQEKNNTSNNNSKDNIDEMNFIKTIDEMKQNTLDLYYDKNSSFKKKIDNLNLKFYLETEKYLNNFKINDHIKNQKLQANLFIILFQQINIFIEEIERLNLIIIENKYKKEKIMQRTNELIEKKQNILIKDNLIQSLKKSNTNTEKKLLQTLINEDKLIKDNERLRKENETYKTLTIVFENELKNSIKKNGLTPQKNKISRHIKTYSDYGVPSNSIINELVMHSNTNNYEEPYETMNNENKYTTRDKKRSLYISKPINKDLYNTNKNNNSINIDRKAKNYKIIKKNVNKFSPNNRQKQKQNQDNKIKVKKDSSKISNSKKIPIKNKNNNNLCYSFVYNNKNVAVPPKNQKVNVLKKNNNGINIDSISNNINATINTNKNTMTETNNLSFEKTKDKNFKKIDTKKGYHKKQKTMSEIYYNEIVKIQIINDELNNNNSINKKDDNNKIITKKNSGKFNNKNSPHNKINKNKIKKNF